MHIKLSVILLLLLLSLGVSAQQGELSDQQHMELTEQQLKELLAVKIRTVETLAFSPSLVDAVRRQNLQNLSMELIQQRDEEWRASEALTPFKLSLQTSRAGKVLKRFVSDNPAFNEAFLTDNQGANVAAFPATSDYWQGDEEKWAASFNGGDGKTFIGPLERDASTETVAVQVSAPVYDQGKTIGVLVVGVTLSYIEGRQQ